MQFLDERKTLIVLNKKETSQRLWDEEISKNLLYDL